MTVKTSKGREQLDNLHEYQVKHGTMPRMLYCIDQHKYMDNGKVKYHSAVKVIDRFGNVSYEASK